MVKTYLKYSNTQSENQLTSPSCNLLASAQTILSVSHCSLLFISKKGLLTQKTTLSSPILCTARSAHQILAGCKNGLIVSFSEENVEEKMELGANKGVTHLVFVDETQFVSGHEDRRVRLWDLLAGCHTWVQEVDSVIRSLLVLGETIAVGTDTGILKCYEKSMETHVQGLPEIVSGCIFQDKMLIATVGDKITFPHNEGVIERKTFARIIEMHAFEDWLLVLNNDKSLEIYRWMTDEELKKKLKRKKKRIEDKGESFDEALFTQNLGNRVKYETSIKFPTKVVSFAIQDKQSFAVSTKQNTILQYTFQLDDSNQITHQHTTTYDQLAHRTPIRTMALSSNDALLLTGSAESVKLWNSESSLSLIQTIPTRYILCSAFLPKNNYFVLGDKEGYLGLYDIKTAALVHELQAHQGALWSLSIHENPSPYNAVTILSGGGDQHLCFHSLVFNKKLKSLKLSLLKTVPATDDVQSVIFMPNGQHYAFSLLDNSIRIHYTDSDSIFLTLYSHSLPVLSLTVTSDNALLCSGSADKNLKLWGLDFGNLHKSIFAHKSPVIQVLFIKDTHYLLSGGKDGEVKFWDMDVYQNVFVFGENYLQGVTAVVASQIGDRFYVSDKIGPLYTYEQSKEQGVYEDEKEQREADEQLKVMGEQEEVQKEVILGIEQVMETLEQAGKQEDAYRSYEESLRKKVKCEKPTISGRGLAEEVLDQLKKVKGNLEESLRFLHLSHVEKLMFFLRYYARNDIEVELTVRVLNFILKNYENHIQNSKKFQDILIDIQQNIKVRLLKQRNIIGFNVAGLHILKNEIKRNKELDFDDDDLFSKPFQF